MKELHIVSLCFVLLYALVTVVCEPLQSANEQEQAHVNAQQEAFLRAQPTPVFSWSLERALMIQLYQARNTRTLTYSYVLNAYNGTLLMSCESLGFPIPATTQITNSETVVRTAAGATTVAQAEPNGLYAPPSTSGTWVMCLAPNGGVEPRYVENHVITTVRPMRMQDGQLVPLDGGNATITLRTER